MNFWLCAVPFASRNIKVIKTFVTKCNLAVYTIDKEANTFRFCCGNRGYGIDLLRIPNHQKHRRMYQLVSVTELKAEICKQFMLDPTKYPEKFIKLVILYDKYLSNSTEPIKNLD